MYVSPLCDVDYSLIPNSNEVLRLFPPIPMTFRKSTKDDHLDGKFVPKGTLIYVPVCLLIREILTSQLINYAADPCHWLAEECMGQ